VKLLSIFQSEFDIWCVYEWYWVIIGKIFTITVNIQDVEMLLVKTVVIEDLVYMLKAYNLIKDDKDDKDVPVDYIMD